MRRATALLSTAAVGVVVGVGRASPEAAGFVGPAWLWWFAYAVFTVVLVFDGQFPGPRGPEVWLATLCLVAAGVYLLAPWWAITPVCLVICASAAGFILTRPAAYAVVGVQTLVIAAGRLGEPAVLTFAATYGAFQLVSVVMAGTVRRESAMRAELAETNEELRAAQDLLRSSAQAGERLRISRELHDLVGHQLTALALELEVAAHHAGGEAAPHVERARRTAKDLLADIRRAVGRMRATPGDMSAAFGTVTGITRPEVHLDVADDLDFTDPERAQAVVRCRRSSPTPSATPTRTTCGSRSPGPARR